MRLKEHIIENNIIKILERDCSQFIKESKKSHKVFLYRGTTKKINDIKALTPREDRKPLDTPSKIHKNV
jgi:hypothetical protein